MEAKRNPYQYKPEYYVQGSTAKKMNTAEAPVRKKNQAQPARKMPERREPARRYTPEREPDRYERLREQEQKLDDRKIIQISRGINFIGMVMLSAAIVATVYCCITYLNLRAENGRLDKSITSLQTELSSMIDANQALEEQITGSIDLDAIYQTAVAELGMVFPNNNEVISYASADTSYVRQYADIKETALSLLDKLIP